METEFFIESFSWNLLGFVKMNDLPSLICTIVSLPDNDLSSFFILSTPTPPAPHLCRCARPSTPAPYLRPPAPASSGLLARTSEVGGVIRRCVKSCGLRAPLFEEREARDGARDGVARIKAGHSDHRETAVLELRHLWC